MITFKQFLAEAFDSEPLPYTSNIVNLAPYILDTQAYFNIKDKNVQAAVSMIAPGYYTGDGTLYVNFGFSRNNNFNLTGTSNTSEALEIYSTIVHIVKKDVSKLISKYIKLHPDVDKVRFRFESYDKRTVRLYSRFANELGRLWRGQVSIDRSDFLITLPASKFK